MTDREMLEFAAKAAGYEIDQASWGEYQLAHNGMLIVDSQHWNPLISDGDALRLAVKLSLHVRMWVYACEIETNDGVKFGLNHCGDFGGDVSKATRYAITRAAAEIGKRTP